MQHDLKLRLGTLADFDALYDIYMDEKVNRFLSFAVMEKNPFQEIFRELLASGELYVYENPQQQIVATCIVRKQKRRAAHVATLSTLATNPTFHSQGIGMQFMKTLIEKLRSENIKRIDLCTETDNLIAQQFYKKLGFHHEATLKKYFKREMETHYVDEMMMVMLLD